jgi:hypothetical protein
MNISRIERVVESGPQVLYDADAPTRAVDSDGARWPESLAAEAFHGLAGEIVRAIEPHSESDPAALLLQFLVAFGNSIGRGPRFLVEGHFHYTNLFCLIVGQTSRGRKGTSWAQVREIFSLIDPLWASTRIHGGIGSGEGIIAKVQDPILRGEKLIEEGSTDKRLLLLETEFAQVLAVAKREGGTASEVLRRAWDGSTLQMLVRHSPAIATGAIISLVGHITKDELLRHLDQTEIANGLMNRFLFCCARRSKCLPEGGSFSTEEVDPLVEKLRRAAEFARKTEKMDRDEGARTLWRTIYPKLTEDHAGLFGAIISRSEAQVLRLSMIFALLDSSTIIRAEHLIAALAVWQFCEGSARHIFGGSLGDPVADEILRALRATPGGLTRSEIREIFQRNKSSDEITRAVDVLLRFGLIEIRTEETSGRPAQRLTARHVGYAVNAVNAKR